MANEQQIDHRFNDAIAAKETITVVYHGGSRPGTKRQLKPIRVTEKELWAQDVLTGSRKLYRLCKIEIVPWDSPLPEYATASIEAIDPAGSLKHEAEEMRALGWHVEVGGEWITLHSYFKNGKPRKTATTGIMQNESAPARPWYVWGPDLAQARTFGHFERALALFLEQARKYAPKPTNGGQ